MTALKHSPLYVRHLHYCRDLGTFLAWGRMLLEEEMLFWAGPACRHPKRDPNWGYDTDKGL